MSSTNVLMVVAVIAVAVAVFGTIMNFASVQTGYASSDSGNVTFQIESKIDITFTNDIINWSTGYVNITGPAPCGPTTEAQLSTDPTGQPSNPTGIYCGINWTSQLQGLTLQSDSNQDIKVNLSSSQDALNLIDGGVAGLNSNFQWKVSLNETNSCNNATAPLTYTEIVSGANVTICDSMNWNASNDAPDIDFLVNISPSSTVLGYRTAIITALAERSSHQNITYL